MVITTSATLSCFTQTDLEQKTRNQDNVNPLNKILFTVVEYTSWWQCFSRTLQTVLPETMLFHCMPHVHQILTAILALTKN